MSRPARGRTIGLAVGLACLATIGPGCSGPAETPVEAGPGVSAGADQPATSRQLLDRVMEANDPAALDRLLADNGRAEAGSVELRIPMSWGEGSAEEVGVVSSPTRIRSRGATYAAIVASRPGGGASRVMLFEQGGTLLGSFGSDPSGGEPGASAWVYSLGSPDSWFVLITRAGGPAPLTMTTDVHLVDAGLPRVLRVHHHPNGLGFTRTRDEASVEGGPRLLFRDPSPAANGVEGWPPSMPLAWSEERSRFRGPSSAPERGPAVYQVEVEVSDGFEPMPRPE